MHKKYLIPIALVIVLLIGWFMLWRFHKNTEINPDVSRPIARDAQVLESKTEDTFEARPEQPVSKVESEVLFDFQVRNIPADVLPNQIRGAVFKIGDSLYAMAYEPNLNFPMVKTTIDQIQWHGVLQSKDGGESWKKFYTIKDGVDAAGQRVKYNPVGVFAEDGQLYIDIANDRGAGSGEGYLKRYAAKDDGATFAAVGCFYFTPEKYYTNEGDLTPTPHNVPASNSCGGF